MQTHPFQDLIDRLDADRREEFEERAGIVEFDGLQPREHAEALALLHVLRRHPLAISGVAAFQLDSDTWVLADDSGRRRLAHLGAHRPVDLAQVLRDRYGGLAVLWSLAP
jgi:hypothetical protein